MRASEPEDFSILLIEDAPATAAVFQLYIEELGLPDPTWVESLEEAVALKPQIEQGDFDLIVSDLMLNEDDAALFLKDIPGDTGCPVIVCSGNIGSEERLELDACSLLPKPVSFSNLARVLNDVVRLPASAQ